MPVVITCPECRRKAKVPTAAVGKTVKCPGCGATFPATTDDAVPPPPRYAEDEDDAPDFATPPATPEDDSRRATRTGVLVLTASQGLLAAGLALQLLLTLFRLATSDSGPKRSGLETFGEVVTLVHVLAQVAAAVGLLIGAAYCALPSAAPDRAGAGAVLTLALIMTILSANPFGEMLRGAMGAAGAGPTSGMGRGGADISAVAGTALQMMVLPIVLDAALQSVLALYARANARRLRDGVGAGMATFLALSYPAARVGLFLIAAVFAMFGSNPHPTFTQVMTVLELLARTALVAWGAVVLLRVWSRLSPA